MRGFGSASFSYFMLLAALSYLALGSAPAWGACVKGGPEFLCLALKYVVYRDAEGDPVLSREQAERNLKSVNSVWKACDLGFFVETYEAISPAERELRFRTGDFSELAAIRETFADNRSLLIAGTGPWDRTGSLGGSKANAWTAMPGRAPFGVIIERPSEANLLAHELGHYLNLRHVSDRLSLMNPVIYARSTRLEGDQCEAARAAARLYWPKAIRSS